MRAIAENDQEIVGATLLAYCKMIAAKICLSSVVSENFG